MELTAALVGFFLGRSVSRRRPNPVAGVVEGVAVVVDVDFDAVAVAVAVVLVVVVIVDKDVAVRAFAGGGLKRPDLVVLRR